MICITAPVSLALAADDVIIKHGNQHKMHFTEMDHRGLISGMNRDIVDELASRMGLQTDHQVCPFKRCTRMLFSGELDLMVFIAVTPERSEFIVPVQTWSNPVPIYFVTRKADSHKLQTYEDLYDFQIGSVNGYVYSPRFDRDSRLKRHQILVEGQLPKMLAAGRIDAFPSYGGLLANLNRDYPDIELAPLVLDQWDTALIAISKNSPLANRADEININLIRMAQDGTLDRIWASYFPGQKMPMPDSLRQVGRNETP